MKSLRYNWNDADGDHALELVYVEGTKVQPYTFGDGSDRRQIDVREFYMAIVPVTQALWTHVMGPDANPSVHRGANLPLENVSWDELTRTGGFFDRINAGPIRSAVAAQMGDDRAAFRLPSESEWEYAARGGPRASDGFRFSGGNSIDAVAWYNRKHGDHTRPVALKEANQLGIYDMSGNVWEWCRDVYTPDVTNVPSDGRPYLGAGRERVLRGGCFHNWAIHCTVFKRYEIAHDYHDGCIGFRPVLAAD